MPACSATQTGIATKNMQKTTAVGGRNMLGATALGRGTSLSINHDEIAVSKLSGSTSSVKEIATTIIGRKRRASA
jgi:hypothetical protein